MLWRSMEPSKVDAVRRRKASRATAAGDPYAGNRPYTLEGQPVRDRLSFYFASRCSLTEPGTGAKATSDDLRGKGCPAR